ncbi:MAG: hypothetical protein AAFU64_05710, partial [Bacteroidota bacterium]
MREKKVLVFFLYLASLACLFQCRRYDPINDRIYDIPTLSIGLNPIQIEALRDAVERYPDRPEA